MKPTKGRVRRIVEEMCFGGFRCWMQGRFYFGIRLRLPVIHKVVFNLSSQKANTNVLIPLYEEQESHEVER